MIATEFKIAEHPEFKRIEALLKSHSFAFIDQAMQLVVADIIDGIRQRRDITGAPFPELSPTTVDEKGHDSPLIHRGLLTDSDTYLRNNLATEGRGEITIKPVSAETDEGPDTPRDEVAYSLQIEGIKGRKNRVKFFPFFGISAEAARQLNDVIDKMVSLVLESQS